MELRVLHRDREPADEAGRPPVQEAAETVSNSPS